MKRCPQCQNMFDDENSFCLNDGAVLIPDLPQTIAYSPPIIQHQPSFVVDLSPKSEIPTQFTPIPPFSMPNQTAKKSSGNYAVPLVIGLLLGGVVAAAAFFIIKSLDEKSVAVAVNSNASRNETSKNSSVNEENDNSKRNEKSTNTNFAGNVREENEKYNGRVIMINAYIRSAPDVYANELETIPLDERINIGKRESPNSPWYRVTCQHGTSGWMHGNTIEFTKQ